MTGSNCPVCDEGSVDLLERVTAAEQHAQYAPRDYQMQQRLTAAIAESSREYQMLRCRGCGLEFSAPLRAPSADWYRLAYQSLNLYPGERWEFEEVLRHVGTNESILEFGCGSGAFLEECRKRHISAAGVDFSDDAVRVCLQRGLQARVFDLTEASHRNGSERATHIVAFQTLEHLQDPLALFRQALCVAASSGHLWVSVPADQRPFKRFGVTIVGLYPLQITETDFLDQPPHHMTRWTPMAFTRVGERTGWRLAEVLYEPVRLRNAVWEITVASSWYRRAARHFTNKWIERGFRSAFFPIAFFKRMTTERRLTGFSMLAHFIPESGNGQR